MNYKLKKRYISYFTAFITFISFLFLFNQKINTCKVKQTCNEIEVNCCFSIGQTCKSAYHIQRHGKRFQASPLDWMRDYSLDTCLHLFETKFEDFFEEITERSLNSENRDIIDTKNNILSIHHFSSKNPLNEEHKKFRSMMLNRAQKLDKILNQAESIALIYSHENPDSFLPTDGEIIEFLKKFSQIYPDRKIYLIVTQNSNIDGFEKSIIFKAGNLEIIKFTFFDIHPEKHYSGNHEAWDKVMNFIKLVKKND